MTESQVRVNALRMMARRVIELLRLGKLSDAEEVTRSMVELSISGDGEPDGVDFCCLAMGSVTVAQMERKTVTGWDFGSGPARAVATMVGPDGAVSDSVVMESHELANWKVMSKRLGNEVHRLDAELAQANTKLADAIKKAADWEQNSRECNQEMCEAQGHLSTSQFREKELIRKLNDHDLVAGREISKLKDYLRIANRDLAGERQVSDEANTVVHRQSKQINCLEQAIEVANYTLSAHGFCTVKPAKVEG